MSLRLASIDSLMINDALLIESNLSSLSERDWQAITPSGRSPSNIKRGVKKGDWVVLNDAPQSPLFAIEAGSPTANPNNGGDIDPYIVMQLTQRFASAGSATLFEARKTDSLPPSPPLYYTPEAVLREENFVPEITPISDNLAKKAPNLELTLNYNDSEKTYASNVPYSVMFSDPSNTVIKGSLNDMGWAVVEGGPNYPAEIIFGDEAEKVAAESALESQYQQLDSALNDTAAQVAKQALSIPATNPDTQAKQATDSALTETFNAAVNNKIAELNAQSAEFDNLSFLAQSWQLAKATQQGASNGFNAYLPDLGDFGELMQAADIDISMLVDAISSGNIDALQAKLTQWKLRGDTGLKQARKAMETLILLLSDPVTRDMLASMPKRILAAMPEDKIAELTAYQATQLGMDTALITGGTAVGSLAGGVGGPVAAGILFTATTARKGGKALEGTIKIVTDISTSLKKINNQHDAKPYKKDNISPLESGNKAGSNKDDNEDKTYKCDWKDCKGQHKKKIKYPNNGKLTKSSNYAKKWVDAGLEPWNLYGPGQDSHATLEGYKAESSASYVVKAAAMQYPQYHTQKHHLIPIAIFNNFNQLKHNAKLAGYDINHKNNGMCLPSFTVDIIQHDLQCHRGSHPNNHYGDKLKAILRNTEHKSSKLCSENNQKKIITELDKISARVTVGIKSWKLLLRSTALSERNK